MGGGDPNDLRVIERRWCVLSDSYGGTDEGILRPSGECQTVEDKYAVSLGLACRKERRSEEEIGWAGLESTSRLPVLMLFGQVTMRLLRSFCMCVLKRCERTWKGGGR